MASKSEISRSAQERSGPKKEKLVRKPHRKVSQIARVLLSESPEQRHIGAGFLNRRDRSKTAARTFHPRTDMDPQAVRRETAVKEQGETMAKHKFMTKEDTRTQAARSGPAVRVEFPLEGEAIGRSEYTFHIGTISEANNVEVSIDQGEWKPCRESLGLWWYDWTDYAQGDHVVVARSRIGNDISSTSAPRRFTVE